MGNRNLLFHSTQNGYKEETDEEFLSEALTLLRKITDEAANLTVLQTIHNPLLS